MSKLLVHAYDFGPFRLDVLNHRLLRDGAPIAITPKALDTLLQPVRNSKRVLSKGELMNALWTDTAVEEANLSQQIFTLRKILGLSVSGLSYIETVPKRGYRLSAAVNEIRQQEPDLPASGRDDDHVTTQPLIRRLPSIAPRVARAGSVVVFVVVAGTLAARSLWSPSAQAPERIMVAVQPFEDLSGDPAHEYFSDGLTDEMIAELGRLHPQRLGAIARTSSMRYKATQKTITEIGRELDVDYILEGRLRRSGQRVRIDAQLTEVHNPSHRWASSYEGELRDVLTLQRDIARAVAQDIRLQLTPNEQARLTSARAMDPQAFEDYLVGRFYWSKRTEAAFMRAIEHFERAVARDPGYAVPYAGLADCYGPLAVLGYISPLAALPQGKAAALKAVELDDELAEGHTSLGLFTGSFEWDWRGAEKSYQRAIELNPSYAPAHHWYANVLIRQGRVDESLAESRRARDLDPLSLIFRASWAHRLYLARRHDEAVVQLRQVLNLDARFGLARLYLGLAYEQQGDHDHAISELEAAGHLERDNPSYLAALGHTYAVAGRRHHAVRILEEMQDLSTRRYVAPYHIAVVYAGLGDKDQSFNWLEQALKERSPLLTFVKVDPALDTLRLDHRFQTLMRRVGLSDVE